MGCSAPWILCLINIYHDHHLKIIEQILSNVQNNLIHERCMNIELFLLHSVYDFEF